MTKMLFFSLFFSFVLSPLCCLLKKFDSGSSQQRISKNSIRQDFLLPVT